MVRRHILSHKTVHEEVVIKTEAGQNVEIDSVIVNQNGKIESIGQVKLSDSPNSYYEAVSQFGDNWQFISGQRGEVTEVSTASGQLPPSSVDPNVVDEAYTVGPAGSNAELPREIPDVHTNNLPDSDELTVLNRRSYTYTTSQTKEQIEEAYETFKQVRTS